VAVALQATLGACASLALAYLSYEHFEKRFLRLKRLFETSKEPDTRSRTGAMAWPHHSMLGGPDWQQR
jgi:peptidoglycan/LPS O-acetylase OafA/YrhL